MAQDAPGKLLRSQATSKNTSGNNTSCCSSSICSHAGHCVTNGKMHISCSPPCRCKYRECPVQRQEIVRNPSPSMAALIGSPGAVPELAAFVSCRAETRGADLSGMPGSVKGDSEPFLAPPPCRARSCPGQKAPFLRPPFSFFPGPNAMISWWYKRQSKGCLFPGGPGGTCVLRSP